MTKNKISAIKFEKISGTKKQKDALYKLLKKRKYNISHKSIPIKSEHNKFVASHPYRAWYIIKINTQCIGSVYILKNNCIGIDILNDDYKILPLVFNFVFEQHKPLKEIKSERPPNFYINVSPKNKKMKSQLDQIGAKKIQITYALDLVF